MPARLAALLFSLALLVSACASVPKVCEPRRAHDVGYSLAMEGKSLDSGEAKLCGAVYEAEYRRNLMSGYEEGRAKHCEVGAVEAMGLAHGQAGDTVPFDETRYRACQRPQELAAAFR